MIELPLFPLNLVLFPGMRLPLHVFEERYKLMIGKCIAEQTEFGIVYLSDDRLSDVGCTARVTQVLQEFEDGRMNVLVAGGRPFTLMRRIDDMPYPAGEIDLLDDDVPADAEDDDPAVRELATDARERYADLVEQVTDERPAADDLEDLDAYGMAATIEFDAGTKQQLLELRSEPARLEYVRDLFVKTMKRISQSEEAGELARSNGRIRFST